MQHSAALWTKRILLGFLSLLILLVIGVALIPNSVWKRLIVYEVTQSTHRKASIDGPLELHLFRREPQLVMDGFELANVDWARGKDMVKVDHFDVSVSLWSLLKFDPQFPHLIIDNPSIALERDGKGRANWDFSTPGATKPPPPDNSPPPHIPVIQHLSVSNGQLRADDRLKKLKFDGQINIDEKTGTKTAGQLSVKGKGSLNEKPFELRFDGEPLINVDSSKPYSFDAMVTAADIKLTAHTDIPHPFDLGSVRSKFHITGKDLADVYYLTNLALPNTPPYDVSGTAVRDKLKFQVDDFKGRLGNSDIQGRLGIDTGAARPKLTANLTSKLLDINDLAAPLGSQATAANKADTLAKPATAKPAGKKNSAPPPSPIPPAEPALLLPDADLQVNRVRAMDADFTFAAAAIKTSKMPMKDIRFHLLLDNGKLTMNPLAFTLPQGEFSGSVGLNARGPAPETDIDMKIDQVDLAQFRPKDTEAASAPISGSLQGRIRLHGTGSSVHKTALNAVGDITMIIPNGRVREAFMELTGINVDRGLTELLFKKQQATDLRCGIINFHAADGDLKATTMVIDTTRLLLTGTGQVAFDDEAIDMSIRGKPKGIRFVRIQSPILVRGTLSKPSVGLKTSNVVGQAAAATALGVLLTPAAAVLAFVDPGLAKDANCQALLAQAEDGKNIPNAPDPRQAPTGTATH
jgi:uncharacterized protein involved in outer membrane biogenesis